MTEHRIRSDGLENFRFLKRYRSLPPQPAHTEAILLTSAALGPVSVRELLTGTWYDKERQMEALAELWRLLAVGALDADLSIPLTMKTQVWRRA